MRELKQMIYCDRCGVRIQKRALRGNLSKLLHFIINLKVGRCGNWEMSKPEKDYYDFCSLSCKESFVEDWQRANPDID